MKKLFALLLCLSLLAGVAMAGSVQTIRGLVYAPAKQALQITTSTVRTIFSDSTYVAPYTTRVFCIYLPNDSLNTIKASVEASPDNSRWFSIDNSTLASIATGEVATVRIQDNCLPYWRVRGAMASSALYATPEVWTVMSTN